MRLTNCELSFGVFASWYLIPSIIFSSYSHPMRSVFSINLVFLKYEMELTIYFNKTN